MKKKEIKLRDSGVVYDAKAHTYTYCGTKLKGITGTLINKAYPKGETYKDAPEEVLEHAAKRGSACHQAVANAYQLGLASTGYEETTAEAVKLLKSKGLTPIRFEYVVSDFMYYASPIDIVCTNENGDIAIVDMKFTSKLLYEQVTLQVSIYKRFFHIVNSELEAKSLWVLHIHTNDRNEVIDSGIYEITPVSREFIDGLIKADQDNVAFDVNEYYGDIPALVEIEEPKLIYLQNLIKEKTEEMNKIKETLFLRMEEENCKQYATEHISLALVTPKPRASFDAKAFKTDHPEMYKDYVKTAETKPSLRITIK